MKMLADKRNNVFLLWDFEATVVEPRGPKGNLIPLEKFGENPLNLTYIINIKIGHKINTLSAAHLLG